MGIDTNGDRVLQASEIQQTAYVCNGVSAGGASDVGRPACPATTFLNQAILIGQACDLTDANLSGTGVSSGADLTGINLSGADLTGAELRGVNLTGANLTGANLTNATLFSAKLTGAIRTGGIWRHTTCPDGTNSDSLGGLCR
jgi:uncharacterized protein YjbI with pentapeptide repeats